MVWNYEAIKGWIVRGSTWKQDCVNERLMKMTFELTGKSNTVIFVGGYAPTEASKHEDANTDFWRELHSMVTQVPSKEHFFVLMDANAHTGKRGGWGGGRRKEKQSPRSGWAGGRDILNDTGLRLPTFAGDLSIVNTVRYFSTPKKRISRTFQGSAGPDDTTVHVSATFAHAISGPRLVGNVKVYPQLAPEYKPDSDHITVTVSLRLLGRFVPNRRERRSKGGLNVQ